MSIYSSLDTRRDLLSGSPSYTSIVDYTGIASPTEIEQLLGPPNENQQFALSATDAARLPRRIWVRCFDSLTADIAVAMAGMSGGFLSSQSVFVGWGLVLAAAMYQILGYSIALWVFIQHPQLRK